MTSNPNQCPIMEKCKCTEKVCVPCPSKKPIPEDCSCFSPCLFQGEVCETCAHLERVD